MQMDLHLLCEQEGGARDEPLSETDEKALAGPVGPFSLISVTVEAEAR